MRYKHKWEVSGDHASIYDTDYRCTKCNAHHTISTDDINSELPEYGCYYPRHTSLQKLNTQVVWAKHWILKEFFRGTVSCLNISEKTGDCITAYNKAVRELKYSLGEDYNEHKRMILEIREERKQRGESNE